MEGGGAYNCHALLQADGISVAMPHLQRAARLVQLAEDQTALWIADYGSSQGRNSLRPMVAAISALRERFGTPRPILVAHTDLPGNDFTALFETVNGDPASYLTRQADGIFPLAVGRSFYEPLLPPNHVVLGWSSFAAHWLSRLPGTLPGHFHELCVPQAARSAFRDQAREDWRRFLTLRGGELRPTGRLVIVLPTIGDDGLQGYEPLLNAANRCIAEMVGRGQLSVEERAHMAIADRIRSREELLQPFEETGRFADLAVESLDIAHGPDRSWEDYTRHRDAAQLAVQRARLFRATFTPSLAKSLDPGRSPGAPARFAEELEAALAKELAHDPFQVQQTLAIMVLVRLPSRH